MLQPHHTLALPDLELGIMVFMFGIAQELRLVTEVLAAPDQLLSVAR